MTEVNVPSVIQVKWIRRLPFTYGLRGSRKRATSGCPAHIPWPDGMRAGHRGGVDVAARGSPPPLGLRLANLIPNPLRHLSREAPSDGLWNWLIFSSSRDLLRRRPQRSATATYNASVSAVRLTCAPAGCSAARGRQRSTRQHSRPATIPDPPVASLPARAWLPGRKVGPAVARSAVRAVPGGCRDRPPSVGCN